MPRTIEWTNRALRSVSRLDRPTRKRIVTAVERFAETGQGDVKRLQGRKPTTFRLRVGGWRILFTEEGSVLLIRLVRSRGNVY